MTPRMLAWPVGLVGSLLAHGAVIAGLQALVAPRPIEDQIRPETRLDVQTHALQRTDAPAAQAQAEAAGESQSAAAPAASAAIPHSSAQALAATPDAAPETQIEPRALSGADPSSQALAVARPPANTLATVAALPAAAVPVSPDVTEAPPAAAPPAEAAPAQTITTPAQAIAATEVPGAATLSVTPAFSGLSASAPAKMQLPDSAASISPAADLPPPALPVRTDVPAPSAIDPARPAFALAQSASADTSGLPALAPDPAGLAETDATSEVVDAALPDTLRLTQTGPQGAPATVAALVPDPAASSQPARAEAIAATPSVREAAPARGQATPVVAGAARLDAAPAVAARARPAAAPDPLLQLVPPGPAEAPRATAAPANAAPAAQTAPRGTPAATAAITGRPVPPARPGATAIRAALAFSGGDGDIDPLSLAAFQSFVAPDRVPDTSDPLRDGLEGLLAAIPCSRLQLAFEPATASLRVDGHIPDDSLRSQILSTLQAEMGADIAVSDNMLMLPRPQCDALSGISTVGLPQSTDQATNPLLLGESLHARALDFTAGELIYFDLTAPDYDAFVYVDYFDANGNVLHISPNDAVPLIFARAETTFRVGAASPEETDALRLFVEEPFGREIAVAFAASVPLYDGTRPIVEPSAPYIDWLQRRVAAARADYPDFKGEWVYFFVTTAAE